MKDNRLTIQINKPLKELFLFAIDPQNTPKWVSSVMQEERSTNPTKLGTIYKNTGDGKTWNTYKITEFEENKLFTFSLESGNYHCRYTFTPIDENTTEMEYYEWVDQGEVDGPFTQDILEKLKQILEK